MGIRLEVESYCETCPEFDPEDIKCYCDDKVHEIVVACSQRRICNHIKEHVCNCVNSEKNDGLNIPKFEY